jgi:hypothetical protein
MRDKETGNSDAVLDGSDVLAQLWIDKFVLEITALANGKRHPTVKKADPMPEKRERLGGEMEITERGVIMRSRVLDRRCQGQRHVDKVRPETVV